MTPTVRPGGSKCGGTGGLTKLAQHDARVAMNAFKTRRGGKVRAEHVQGRAQHRLTNCERVDALRICEFANLRIFGGFHGIVLN